MSVEEKIAARAKQFVVRQKQEKRLQTGGCE